MVLEWGMSDALGLVVAERPGGQVYLGEGPWLGREYSEHTARRVDEAVEHIITTCYGRALSSLQQHRGGLERVAKRLREMEELDGDEILGLVRASGDPIAADRTDGRRVAVGSSA
jgi:cell division protease FtsH